MSNGIWFQFTSNVWTKCSFMVRKRFRVYFRFFSKFVKMFLFKILLILFINLDFPLAINSTKPQTAEKRLLTLVNGDPFYEDFEPRNFRLTLYHRHRPLFLKKYKRKRVILFQHRHFHHHFHQSLDNNRVRLREKTRMFHLKISKIGDFN